MRLGNAHLKFKEMETMFGVPLLDVEDNKKRLLLFFLIPMGVWFYLVIYGDK